MRQTFVAPILGLILLAGPVWSETGPAFEAASVKPTSPVTDAGFSGLKAAPSAQPTSRPGTCCCRPTGSCLRITG